MAKFPNILILGGILVFGVIILVLAGRSYLNWRQQKSLQLTSTRAVVVSKKIRTVMERGSGDKRSAPPLRDYLVGFSFPQQDVTQEFKVSSAQFKALNVGDSGLLWHQGTLFNRFEPQTAAVPSARAISL